MNNISNHSSPDQFDQYIRQAIDNQDYAPDIAGFKSLIQKYEDHIVREKMQHFQAPFQQNSWVAIQQRLAAYQQFKARHFKARLFELLSMFLILFSTYWYLPLKIQNLPSEQNQLQELTFHDGTSNISNIKNIKTSTSTTNNQANIESNNIHNILSSNHQSENLNSSNQQNSVTKQKAINNTPRSNINKIAPSVTSENIATEPSLLSTITNLNKKSFLDEESAYHQEKQIQDQQFEQVQELPLNHLTSPVSILTSADLMEGVLSTPGIKPNLKPWFWFDIGFNVDRDLVKSPYPTQLSEQQLGRISGNYGFRTGVVFHWSFIDMHLGIRYNKKDYESVYGGNNQVRVLSVPLTARAKLKQIGRFQGYLLGGAVANYAIHANYSEFKLFEEHPELKLTENNTRVSDAYWLSNNAYENGILEGETIKGNQYYTLNLGLGMEYQIAPRMKIYLEQTYDHHFGSGSVGPGFDRFFTTSAAIGMRYAILSN